MGLQSLTKMQSQERQDRQLVLPPRQRGPYATRFRNVEIVSNHYEATLKGITKIVIFSMKVTPHIQADNASLRQQIVNEIRSDVSSHIRDPVFRGFCIFSREECPGAFEVRWRDYTVAISQRKVFEVADKPNVFLLFLNNSLRGIMGRLGYIEIGRTGKYFTPTKPTPIDNLHMYKGFSSNFLECEKGMFLRVDSARKIVRSTTVLEEINSIYKRFKDADKEERRNQVKKALINSIVMTNYGKCTFYRVLDIDFKSMNEVRVNDDCPTLKDYYLKRYGIAIKNEGQPLLQAENKIRRKEVNGTDQGPTYLIPELCQMTGIPDDFDEHRRKNISQATILPPSDKYREIEGFMKELQKSNEVKTLSDIGINLSSRMNKFQAKEIPKPALQLGSNKFVERGKQAFFNLFGQPIFSGRHPITCVLVHPKNSDVSGLIDTMDKTARNLKVTLTIDKLELKDAFKDRDIISGIERALKSYPDANILMVVIPNNLKTAYPKFKQATLCSDRETPIVTQFVTDGTLRRKSGAQSVHTKLLLQMIAKRGNILWVPSYQEEMNNALDKTMLMGVDTASKGGVSVMAACGTVNSSFSLMASATAPNEGNEKKFNNMLTVATQCIQGYVTRNKGPPSQLIVFLNGSPGDQVNLIQQHFARALVAKITDTYNADVKLTVVMVNLRNSERFFTAGHDIKNVFPGTLVSSCVVSKAYDFFIVSQQSTKGSVVPNHYKVIYTTSKIEEGHLQELIFSQCFNYANWTGSIKVPAILQYTKKCARFNAQVLSGSPVSTEFNTKPYFI